MPRRLQDSWTARPPVRSHPVLPNLNMRATHPLALRCALAATLLAAPAAAQSTVGSLPIDDLAHVAGPVRHAGTYHLASGTWTRSNHGGVMRGLADNIYSNTAGSGLFYPGVGPTGNATTGPNGFGGWVIDAAELPAAANPGPFSPGGTVDFYQVTSVQIAYCDFEPTPASAGFRLAFFDDYEPCTQTTRGINGSLGLTGLPSNGCWIVNIDLSGGEEFCIDAVGGATNPAQNTLGIFWDYIGTGTEAAGLLIAGDPFHTDPGWPVTGNFTGSDTYYGGPSACDGGTGYQNADTFYVQQGTGGTLPNGSGCYQFANGYVPSATCGVPPTVPWAGFHVQLNGQSCDLSTNVVSDPGCTGAVNSTGVSGKVEVLGSTSVGVDQCTLRGYDLPPNQWGLFAAGRSPLAPQVINSGNGWLCIDPGATGGLGRFAGPGQIKNAGASGEISLSSAAGEWDMSMIPTSVGTYSAASGVTTYFQVWHRDTVGLGFNFSDSCSVSW